MTGLRPLSLALGLLLSLPVAAQAASLRPLESCFFHATQAQVAASGFAPASRLELTFDGSPLGAVTTDERGDVRITINLSELEPDVGQRSLVLRASDGSGTTAATRLRVTRRRAVFAEPTTTTDVRTWKASFRLFGFGSGRAFLHYVSPKGRHVKTVRLGALRGPCGRLAARKRRVLPVAHPEYGRWKLQFDTRRRYHRKTRNRRVVPVRVYRPRAR